MIYADPPASESTEVAVTLRPGMFIVLTPEDAHKTECFAGVSDCRKAVAKIPVELLGF